MEICIGTCHATGAGIEICTDSCRAMEAGADFFPPRPRFLPVTRLDIGLRHFEQQMEMIPHQHPSIDTPAVNPTAPPSRMMTFKFNFSPNQIVSMLGLTPRMHARLDPKDAIKLFRCSA